MRKLFALIVAVMLVSLARTAAAGTWTIPGTVNTSGLNGTRFVSDLAITNPGTDPAFAILTLAPASGTTQSLQFLAPGQTLVFRNVLQQLWGATGAEATVVDSTVPLLIRARTYNAAASGTYGVALPVVADDRFLFPGDSADSLWISQSANGSAGYRTNVAVVFPDAGGGDATVTVYDAAGAAAGSQAFSLPSAGFQQFAVASFAGAVAVGRARIEVSRGRATAYAVVVDNVTGDSSLFTFDDLPAGRQDVLVNGVARANGRNSTFFRTDARIYNPGATDATVTVAFHANQNANTSPATVTFNVAAGQVRDVVDVLSSLLSLPVGSAGALRFTSAAPVSILCRTSNVDPAGARPGTYGAQQKPVPILSFLSPADGGAVVTGVRQGADFRTNVGFAAGADGATYSLTLKNAAGSTVGTASASLGPWGWTQPNVQDLFPAVTVPADATLQVNVTAGSLDVFDSSIDNASGDPVVTPIMPLPVTIPSTATIGPSGGSVQSDDGKLTLKVPAGAFATPTVFSVVTTTVTAPDGTGPAYSISPAAFAPLKPVLLVFRYEPTDLEGSEARWLVPALFGADGQWYPTVSWRTDTSARTVTTAVTSLTPQTPPAARGRARAASLPNSVRLAYFVHLSGPAVVGPGATSPFRLVVLDLYESDSGPPGALREDPLASLELDWYVDGHLGGAGAVGTVSPSVNAGASTVFHAPACPPEAGFATVSVSGIQGGLVRFVVGHSVSIFPLQWFFRLEEQRDRACALIESPAVPTAAYTMTASVDAHFAIDADPDHKPLVIDGDRPSPDLTISPPVACPLWNQCTLSWDGSPPAQRVSGIAGYVWRGRLNVAILYYHAGEPGITATCAGFTGHLNPALGASDHSDVVVGWRGDSHTVSYAPVEGLSGLTRFTVKPTETGICP